MEKRGARLIEQIVLETLQKGALSTTQLIRNIVVIRPNTTKQGVYRVLRKLKAEEKIVMYGKSVSLNLHWVKNMSEFFSLAHFYYSPQAISFDSFLNIKEKDKIVYHFKNLNFLDSFWSHAFHMFTEVLESKEPIFAYNPHEWFAYARQKTEYTLIKTMREKNRQVLITVAHNNPLDRELKQKFKDDYIQYNIANKKIIGKPNYYLNIFGEYLIEVFIDPNISNQIDVFFAKTKVFSDQASAELLEIVSMRGKNKLVISRNEKRAEKYKKILGKEFYIIK